LQSQPQLGDEILPRQRRTSLGNHVVEGLQFQPELHSSGFILPQGQEVSAKLPGKHFQRLPGQRAKHAQMRLAEELMHFCR
jgi:hypothetical protein